MFGDQKTNPYGFEEMTLDKACTFFSGTGFPNDYQGNASGDYPFYKVGDISRNVQEGNVFLVSCDNYISNEIAAKLKKEGLIRDASLFVWQERVSSYYGDEKAGTYTLNTSQTAEEMLAVLAGEASSTEE